MAIVLVDYHKGNIRSVQRGLQVVGAQVLVSDNPEDVRQAEAVVLPGVGAYRDASDTLQELGLMEALREVCSEGVPFLGICLGMHLMFEGGIEHASAENPAPGLGLLPGVVGRVSAQDAEGRHFKVPHVGWNSVHSAQGTPGSCASAAAPACAGEGECPAGEAQDLVRDFAFARALFEGIRPGEFFYFTHSFQAPEGEGTVARTCHAQWFPSAVVVPGRPQFGVQFHPEKSSDAGAALLRNFVRIANG